MGGYNSCGRRLQDINPRSNIPKKIMTVVTGLLTEKFGSAIIIS